MRLPAFALTEIPRAVVMQEAWVAMAALVTLLGVWLCWGAPRYRMSIEERAKDGKLTEDQARRKIRAVEWGGPAVAACGVALLTWAILR